MTTYERLAQRLAARAEQPVFFEEADKFSPNRFADVGALPKAGDPEAAMREIVVALPNVRDPFQLGGLVFYAGYLAEKGGSARGCRSLASSAPPGACRPRDPGRVTHRACADCRTAPRARGGWRESRRASARSRARAPTASSGTTRSRRFSRRRPPRTTRSPETPPSPSRPARTGSRAVPREDGYRVF